MPIVIEGKILGTKSKRFGTQDPTWAFGVSFPKLGGFKGEEETVEVRLPKDLATPNLLQEIDGKQGKQCRCIVVQSKGKTENGISYNNFQSTGVIAEMIQVAPAQQKTGS